MTAPRTSLAVGTLALLFAVPFPVGGQGVSGVALKTKYEAAETKLAAESMAAHEKLDSAYNDRLKKLAASSADTTLAAAYARERARLETGKAGTEGAESPAEITTLRDQYETAATNLAERADGRSAALAAAYLFRLCAVGENAFAETEHARLAGKIAFEKAESGRSDLPPTADAFVRSGSFEARNFGGLDHLMVRAAPSGGTARRGYLRFDLSKLGRRVNDARLRLVCTGNYGASADEHVLNLVGTDKAWKESDLTYATRPKTLEEITRWSSPKQGGVVYVDVTKWLNARLAAKARWLDFSIISAGTQYISYGAREHANPWARPVLMIDDAGAAMGADLAGAMPPSEVFNAIGKPGTSVAPGGKSPAAGQPVEMTQVAPEKDLALKGSVKQVKALLVRDLEGGAMAGFAQPLTATAVKSGGDEAMAITFNQKVGSDMTTALRAVVRGLQLRYGAWPRGYGAELGFEEKYDPKDGPSAALACALLIDALVEDSRYDPAIAVTGDLNSDLSVQPVGGVPAKIRGAAARGAKIVVVPVGNRRELQDLAVLGELKPFADAAVFTARTFDEARDLVLAERSPSLQLSLDEFALLQAGGTGSAGENDRIAKLRGIVERTPNFLSAELILRAATGQLPKTLSLAGSFEAIDTSIAPFIEAILGGNGKSITDTKFASTMESLRRIRTKLDPRVHPLHTALLDLIVFDRRHVDRKFGNEIQLEAARTEQSTLAARYKSERDALRANSEIIEELER